MLVDHSLDSGLFYSVGGHNSGMSDLMTSSMYSGSTIASTLTKTSRLLSDYVSSAAKIIIYRYSFITEYEYTDYLKGGAEVKADFPGPTHTLLMITLFCL